MKRIRIGTRSSALALWQANWVRSSLESVFPRYDFELIHIKTQGDRVSNVPLVHIGGEGIFVKQIEIALLNGEVDLAVHSMKDLPTILPDGLTIGAIPERVSPADVLISKNGLDFFHLPPGAKIGTGSLRRRAQLLHARSDLDIRDIRGNVDTRLAKLRSGDMDAIVLAAAGVQRLGYGDSVTQSLPYSISLPAVGQGALCIEIRAEDEELQDIVRSINHPHSAVAVKAERAFLRKLGGGCRVPIAALGTVDSDKLSLVGLVADQDGKKVIRSDISAKQTEAEYMGEKLAERLLDMGAGAILEMSGSD